VAKEIKLDLSNLKSALKKLDASIDDFESYTTSFRTSTMDRLKDFNSDFISKVDALLDNMKNDINSDLMEQLRNVHAAGDSLLITMRDTDELIAGKIRGGDSFEA
jgi:hypothetical protein